MTHATHLLPPLLAGAALLAGCSDRSSPIAPPPPEPVVSFIALGASDSQVGIAGYPLPTPLRVVVGIDGAVADGVPVSWATTSGTISPRSPTTDKWGEALADWTPGPTPGAVQATARMDSPALRTAVFNATTVPEVDARFDLSTANQATEVGTELPFPIAIRVTRGGVPVPGVAVRWSVASGSIDTLSFTGSDGVATARWVVGTSPGPYFARAQVLGHRGATLLIQSAARTGPMASVVAAEGGAQTLPPWGLAYQPLVVRAYDRFGNPVRDVPVAWRVEQGSAAFDVADWRTANDGRARAILGAWSGGEVAIRADLGNGFSARFLLTAQAPTPVIYFDTERIRFVSGWNRSSPAVDTVDVGATVRWQLNIFDYDVHAVEPEGVPTFLGGEFPYATVSAVQRTFTSPGTYRYVDPHTGARGTLVVR